MLSTIIQYTICFAFCMYIHQLWKLHQHTISPLYQKLHAAKGNWIPYCGEGFSDSESYTKRIVVVLQSIQQFVLVGLGICDLVDDQTNATLRNDIRGAVANLDPHDSLGCANAKHWEEVHDWVCAPADYSH